MDANAPHILVVDDDLRLRELLRQYLADNGFLVTTAETAMDARTKLNSVEFDLIVLDLMMPGESGLEFAGTLRRSDNVPLLMLTAMGEPEDRIKGLESGADDYLVKPFEPRELLLRISSILKRIPRETLVPMEIRLGEASFDLEREELRRGAARIRLTSAEAKLLRALAENPGAVLSRDELMRRTGPSGGERAVDVQVNRLRRKIEPDPRMPKYLQTVRGQGYILRPD
jgi:two-component system phosphate regulon response regulator OmpR